MSLSSSLAKYDIQFLSSEMEKLGSLNSNPFLYSPFSIGGGINIKREMNLAKFTMDPHRQQSYSKKEIRDTRELEKTLKEAYIEFSFFG